MFAAEQFSALLSTFIHQITNKTKTEEEDRYTQQEANTKQQSNCQTSKCYENYNHDHESLQRPTFCVSISIHPVPS